MPHELNMIEYVDRIDNGCFSLPVGSRMIFNQKNFLKSQPMLGDYVPTNEDGEVMEKPPRYDDWERGKPIVSSEGKHKYWLSLYKEYQSALDRVLWKGWEWIKDNPNTSTYDLRTEFDKRSVAHKFNKNITFYYSNTTYEKLITSGIKLERIEKK